MNIFRFEFNFSLESKISQANPANIAIPANTDNESSNIRNISKNTHNLSFINFDQIFLEVPPPALALPYLDEQNSLIIPFNAPEKYRWWQGGQSIEESLKELGASEETIKKYVWNRQGGILKKEYEL